MVQDKSRWARVRSPQQPDRTKDRPFWQNLNLPCDNFHGPKTTFQRISHFFLTDYLLCNSLWKELDIANPNLAPRLTLWKSQYPRLNNIKSPKNVSNHFYWLFDIYFLFLILGCFGLLGKIEHIFDSSRLWTKFGLVNKNFTKIFVLMPKLTPAFLPSQSAI